MSIGFESEEASLRKLRERLRNMSDDELLKFGKTVRELSSWKKQLEAAREEWRRRHPHAS